MEFLLPFSATFVPGIFAAILLLCYILWISKSAQRNTGKKRAAPEAAGAWPVIGHLHLLGGSLPPHVTLGNMADKYGPIFTIKLGVHRTLVVGSPELAKECLTAKDKVFASRPKVVAMEHMGYNYAMFGFAPYGPYWRHVRKIVMLELLSSRRLEMLKHIRESEVKASLKEIYNKWLSNTSGSNKVFVEMQRWFGDITLNVILKMTIGERCAEASAAAGRVDKGESFRKALEDFVHSIGLFAALDALPFLRWLDFWGFQREMKKTARELDCVLEKCLEQHKQRRILGDVVKEEKDFMDILLSVLDGEEVLCNYKADTVNKATCLILVLGGMDTIMVALTWALSLLLNNPRVLKKAQDELDTQVGRERQVKEYDIKHLVYIQAILKETLRLYPSGPLAAPHESMEDCNVGGYHVPAGTRLMVNIWKIHRDPQVWSDPCEFRPERFLTTHKNVEVSGQHFELIPFGSGRRMCPGMSFALQLMPLTLASLLHGFEVDTPSHELVDMSESFTLTNVKATPLEVLLTPRLAADLYAINN